MFKQKYVQFTVNDNVKIWFVAKKTLKTFLTQLTAGAQQASAQSDKKR